MMKDNALRIACRARGVVKRNSLPFIFNLKAAVAGVASAQQRFVIGLAQKLSAFEIWVIDIDDPRLLIEQFERGTYRVAVFAVGKKDAHFSVFEDKGDSLRV